MKISKISWRNIGPYGNKLQELEFSDEGGLWMILAPNGHGKSFVVNMPKIMYYGRLDKFKKDDIANRLNRHGWIKGDVQINPQTKVTIERKLSPSDLTVRKNNKDIGKAGISNYQDYIDAEVVELPYHIFSNIVSLSINDFKSFVSMTPNDKRIIIDKLFSMEVLNKMNWLIKHDLRDIKINIDLFDNEISSLQNSVKSSTKELEKLKKKVNEDNTERIKNISKKISKYKDKYLEAKDKLQEYKQKEKDINQSYNIFIEQKSKIQNELNDLNKKIKLYNKDKCPTCETPFTTKSFEILKGDLQEKQEEKQKELETLKLSEKKYKDTLSKVKKGIDKLNDFIIKLRSAYNSLKSEFDKLKIDKPKEFKSIQNIISKSTNRITKKENEKVEYDNKFKYLSILEELYSDAGVKKKILDSYLPTLNKEIEFTLNELHFPYRLRFDNNFEPHMKHLGIDISVETLSTGEKKRVDLAVLISIVRMLKRKYPNLNIFMLDEILSSIDGDGMYDIIGLLKKTAKELSMHIFIISHTPLPIEHFDYEINIIKKDGFSDLDFQKLEQKK